MTVKDLFEKIKYELSISQIEENSSEAFIILEEICGLKKIDVVANPESFVSDALTDKVFEVLEKRKRHLPLQYILGKTQFYGFDFFVSEDTLIPRFDTEHLIEAVKNEIEGKRVLDMCTGSGCIIITLSKIAHLLKAVGVDISENALVIAKKNADNLQTEVEFICSNMFEKIGKEEKFDVIVSNPPYIKTKEIENLMPEVKDHEPHLALDGKEDGLFFYRKIAKESKDYFERNGLLVMEIGYDQGVEVPGILAEEGFTQIEVIKDFAGLDRVVRARYNK